MSRYLICRISNFLIRLEHISSQFFGPGMPPPAASLVAIGHNSVWQAESQKSPEPFSVKQLLGDGILWAVPKHRRSVEKRLKRKFGHPEYNWKPLKLKTNLRTCNQCGHDHEVGVLCPHCYNKVREETNSMQEKIQADLGLSPVDQEVIVLYDGEKGEQPKEVLNGKRVVEMQKPRPMWFSKNLMQKTTQQPATTAEIKPNELG